MFASPCRSLTASCRHAVRYGALGALLFAALVTVGCGGADRKVDVLDGVHSDDKDAIRILTSDQMQIGYRIESMASRADALELCFEFCRHVEMSVKMSDDLCAFASKYPNVIYLQAKCRASRNRAEGHAAATPRQCMCQG